MLQIYLFLSLIIFGLILLSINIKIGTIEDKIHKKKKKICVLKNCNVKNKNEVINFNKLSIRNEINRKLSNTNCPYNNVSNRAHNKFYLN